MKAGILLSLLGLVALPRIAKCAPIEIDVPAYRVWCTSDTLHPSADGSGQQGAELMKSSTDVLSDEGRAKKLVAIGLPFVTTIAKAPAADRPNDVNVTVCSAVPADAPAPGGKVVAATVPHRKGLADVCDQNALDACSDALDAAMKAAPWQLDQAGLDAATRREHPALTNDVSPDNVVNSLLNTQDILLGGPATEGALSALKTGKVVIAILVEVQEAPK